MLVVLTLLHRAFGSRRMRPSTPCKGRGRLLCVCVAFASTLALSTVGCATRPPKPPEQSVRPIEKQTPPPSLAAIAQEYNARVADLSVLRSPVTMLLDRPGADGGRERNQIEGSMQWQLPMRMSLRGDKVGQTLFWVGSNEMRYWSIDVGSDEKFAVVGTHALLSPRKVASLGLPAHPLDVLEALCVTPLTIDEKTTVRWGASAGTVEVVSTAQLGVRVTRVLDSQTFEPRSCELRDSQGTLLLRASLSRFKAVPVVGNTFSKAIIAGTMDLRLPLEDTNITLLISDPQNPGSAALRTKPFDPEALLKAHDVSTVRDLDTAVSASPAMTLPSMPMAGTP